MFDPGARAPQDARMRIASLIASSTEIVCALGFGDDLVGRSHECDYPEWVKRLPALTEPKLPTHGTSYEIDQRIKAVLQEGLAVYRVFADKLEAVRPEVIVTQSQCEVCAVSLSDVEDAVCRMVSSHPRIVSREPNDLAGVFRNIRKVAEALGAPGAGARLVAWRCAPGRGPRNAPLGGSRGGRGFWSAWVLAHDGHTLCPANGSLASNLRHRTSRSLLSLFFAIFVAPPWFGHGSLPSAE
jgi:hypothetical protein